MNDKDITIAAVPADMIANNLAPSEPIHPGEIIKDEIEYLGITQKQLSRETGIPTTIISEIIHGKRQVSVEYAMLFNAAINLDEDMLLRMQMDYNKEVALRDSTFLERLKNVRKIAASIVL